MNRREAGRLGGLQTYLRHGREHMSAMGQKGGRPPAKPYSELFPAAVLSNEKEDGIIGELNNLSLDELQRRWKIKQGEGLALG